jgi:hypothetical protein
MNKDAFELVWRLVQNEKVVRQIIFSKKGFRVIWAEKSFLNQQWYRLGEFSDLDSFLEIYETYEERSKS